jgi:hypothetical protein
MQIENLRSSLIADCIVLFAVALISALPYIGRLGFYADDRDYLGILTHYSGSGFISQFQGLAHEEPAKASARQGQIMQSMAADVPSLPSNSVLLLDGFCRYSGPGFVFETDGDATGAVQLVFKDASLRSDVVSTDLHFNKSAVDTTYYGAPEEHYPYTDHLFIYNAKYRTFRNLRSVEDAREYLAAENPTGNDGCPAARDGNGEKIF